MTKRRIIVVFVAALTLILPVTAFAATSAFDDVSDDSVYVGDINWLAAAGVTRGCNPPANTRFCPSSNVTREQMAAFMHRLAANQVVDAGTLEGFTAVELAAAAAGDYFAWADDPIIVSHNVWTEIGELQVTIPANGGVLSISSAVAFEPATGTAGSFATVSQTLNTSCSGSTATTLGYADTVNAFYDMATLMSAGEVKAGVQTIRTCVLTEQLNTWEKTLVTQSEISLAWAPHSLGGHQFESAGTGERSIDAAVDRMRAKAEAMRDALDSSVSD